MRITLSLLLLAATAGVQPATAQDLQPTHTLQLPDKEFILGAVRLANGSPVVWTHIGSADQMRLRAYTPAGQPAWDATLQKATTSYGYGKAQLTAWGNRLVLTEFLEQPNDQQQLKAGQTMLRVIGEQGHVSSTALDAPTLPANAERHVLGSFVDNDGYYLLTEQRATKAATEDFFVDHYDLASKKAQRTKLQLPARYGQRPDKTRFTDWVFGGHRADRNYFYRYAGAAGEANEYPEKSGPEFEVRILDNTGRAVSGFTTTLHQQLHPGTFSYYSGRMPHAPAQGHTPVSMQEAGYANHIFSDLYDRTMGGTGDFYLDPATGECWFWGEYASAPFTTLRAFLKPTDGTYLQRYSAEGKLLSAAQAPYPVGTSTGLRNPSPERRVRLFRSPETGELTMQFAHLASWQLLFATYSDTGQLQTTGAWPGTNKQELGLPLTLLSEQFSTLGSIGHQLSAHAFLATAKATTGLLPRITPVIQKAMDGKSDLDVLYLVPQESGRSLLMQTHFNRKGSTVTLYSLQ